MKTIVLINLLIFGTAFFCSAQEDSEKIREYFYDGEFFLVEEEYEDALFAYKKVYNAGYQDYASINYRIGVCLLNIPGRKEEATPYLEKAVDDVTERYREGVFRENQAPVDAWLYLGNAYRIRNELDKACNSYKKYQNLVEDEESKLFAQSQIDACQKAMEAMDNPGYMITQNMGEMINTKEDNFRPVVSSNEDVMVYMTGLKFYDALFYTERNEKEWNPPINITPQIQSDGDQYITDISPDAKMILLVKQDNFDSDIYYSHFENGMWTKSKPIEKLNTKYYESHASITADGKMIFLASNRKDAVGGMDIYYSQQDESGEWTEYVNAGPVINTAFNEDHPFISDSGDTLVFASQGHGSMGGYDLFYSVRDAQGNWTEPVNFGYPFNTTDDDLFFAMGSSVNEGYRALLAEDGFGQQDIHKILVFDTREAYEIALASLKPTEEEPEEDTTEIEGPVTEPVITRIFKIDPVYFGFDKWNIATEEEKNLDSLVSAMNYFPGIRLAIIGHTDDIGPASYNVQLSKKRANSVKEYLVRKGISDARLEVEGKGEEQPVARNTTAAGKDLPAARKWNRRVGFRILNLEDQTLTIRKAQVPEEFKLK